MKPTDGSAWAPWDDVPINNLCSLDDAAEAICGYQHGELKRGQFGIDLNDVNDPLFCSVRQSLQNCLVRNEREFQYELFGFTWRNDFNAYTDDDALFPQQAYFCWWLEHYKAMTFPQWFNHMPHIESYVDKNGIPKVTADEVLTQYLWGEEDTCKATHESDDVEVFPQKKMHPHVTVADLHAIAERVPAFADFLRAALLFLDKDAQDEKIKEVLSGLERESGWGTSTKGGVSEAQCAAFKAFFVKAKPGRPYGKKK